MATSTTTIDATAMPATCARSGCGHAESQHRRAGFEGMCAAGSCQCLGYVQRATHSAQRAPQPAPPPVPRPVPPTPRRQAPDPVASAVAAVSRHELIDLAAATSEPPTRICTDCEQEKPRSEFYAADASRTLSTKCRDCGSPTKRCTGCGEVKPREEFYRTGEGNKIKPVCRDCDNTKPRTRSLARIVRVRARHRAGAELQRRHGEEFRALLEEMTLLARAEAERLASAPMAEAYEGHTVRLRTGQRRHGQDMEDRIDVARCPECVGYHDRGHRCEACGAVPDTAKATG